MRPGCGRGGVVGLVEDQQRPRLHEVAAEPVPQVRRVLLVLDEVVGDDEPVVRRPGADVVPRSRTDAVDGRPVDDLEEEPERPFHLLALHWSSIDGGQHTTMSDTFRRRSSSRAISPASIVLPSPTPSAMNRLTRGMPRAIRRGSSW